MGTYFSQCAVFVRRKGASVLKRACESHPPGGILYCTYEDSILPIIETGLATLVKDNYTVEAGFNLEPAYGHTPSNVVIHIESSGNHAVLCGDIIHHPVQLALPEWSTKFYVSPNQSRNTRLALLDEYANTNTLMLPAHFQKTEYGRIVRDKNSYKILC